MNMKRIISISFLLVTLCLLGINWSAINDKYKILLDDSEKDSVNMPINNKLLDIQPLSIEINAAQNIYEEGEQIVVKATFINHGIKPVCFLLAQQDESKTVKPWFGFKLMLVGSRGSEFIPESIQQNQELSVITLAPQDSWALKVNLDEIYGVLAADTYTVFVRYRPSSSEISQVADNISNQECLLFSGRLTSNNQTIKIEAKNQTATIQKYILAWKNGTKSEKYQALVWLKNNVLTKGMTRQEVQELLGMPTEKRNYDDWIYSVGRVGIGITFESQKVINIYNFET